MNRETSTYLDAVRFVAALAVFLSHVGARVFSGGFLWQCVGLGAPAVVVFFVLSGFVIGYASERREATGRDYVIARAARIYSVVLPTLLLTIGLDWLGARIAPAVYEGVRPLLGNWWSLPVCLSFTNMAWGGSDSIHLGTDGAYWSLGYEVPYYVLFGLACYGRGALRVVGCLAVAAIVGPHVMLLFPLWLLGLVAYRIGRHQGLGRGLGGTLFVATVPVALWVVTTSHAPVNLSEHDARAIVWDLVLGMLFALHLLGFQAICSTFAPWLARVERPIRWLAGATFTLYLLHEPVMTFVKALSPWPLQSPLYRACLLLVPLLAVFVVAQFTERRKAAWRAVWERLLR